MNLNENGDHRSRPDGLSAGIHGDPEVAARDHEIRSWLRNHDYNVIEIAVSDLDDRGAMIRYLKQLARYLEGKDEARRVEDDPSWYS